MKSKYQTKRQEGFTIIEVMIVLAIAALIMVIVFIAVPQLQRAQRNTARKDVLNRVKTELDNYASNNQGEIPTTAASGTDAFKDGFKTRYITNNAAQFKDPKTGKDITLDISTDTGDATDSTLGTVYYSRDALCKGESVVTNSNDRNYAVFTAMEGGAVYCLDNR